MAFIPVALFRAAHAHPHQFVDFAVEFVVTDSALTGVKVDWYVDEMISAWVISDFKMVPGDTFVGDDFLKYMNEAFYEVQKHYYFVVATWQGNKVKPYRWTGCKLRITDKNLLHYSFLLPFDIPLPEKPGTFTFQFIDETFYIAYTLLKNKATVSGSGAAKTRVMVGRTEYDDMIRVVLKK